MKRRRKRQGRLFPFGLMAAAWRIPLVRRCAWGGLAFIVAVNLAVAFLGESRVFFLSPFHLWDKTRALGFYAVHQLRRLAEPEMATPRQALLRCVQRHRVPKRLVLAVAKAESDFRPYRISRTGAMGTMQLMPDTARDLGVVDPFHPEENADAGVRYLSWLWRRYSGDMRRVAAAYNAGPGRVPRSGPYRVPPETRHYVRKVLAYAREFE